MNDTETKTFDQLETKSMAELIEIHNRAAEELGDVKPVGPKAFNSRRKAAERVVRLLERLADDDENVGKSSGPEDTGEIVGKSPEPSSRPRRPKVLVGVHFRTVREMAEHYLLQPISYKTILAMVLHYFPDAGTTVKCLRWYATQMRDRGEQVPTRPRHASADEIEEYFQ